MIIEIWGKDNCPFCTKAKALVESKSLNYVYKQLDVDFTREELFKEFPTARTFPQIRVDGKGIGGYQELNSMCNTAGFGNG